MGFAGNIVVLALLIFNFLVTIASFVVVYYGITIKDSGEKMQEKADALYNWSMILAVAIGINLVVWLLTVWKRATSKI